MNILQPNITIRIPECKGIQYVIPDIHGCINSFIALIEKIKITKEDQLFLLGDYVDRGNNAKAVIDYIMQLQNDGFKIFPIMGNHEEVVLNNFGLEICDEEVVFGKDDDKSRIYNGNNQIERKYFNFISNLPYYIELENFLLVHAGFDFDIDEPFTFTYAMLWVRGWQYNQKSAKNKTVIYGHTPAKLSIIKSEIEIKSKKIPLDNGCVFYEYKDDDYGNLLCLNLNNFELTIQPNIDNNE